MSFDTELLVAGAVLLGVVLFVLIVGVFLLYPTWTAWLLVVALVSCDWWISRRLTREGNE